MQSLKVIFRVVIQRYRCRLPWFWIIMWFRCAPYNFFSISLETVLGCIKNKNKGTGRFGFLIFCLIFLWRAPILIKWPKKVENADFSIPCAIHCHFMKKYGKNLKKWNNQYLHFCFLQWIKPISSKSMGNSAPSVGITFLYMRKT